MSSTREQPDISERLAGLSPGQRELLERRLLERGADAAARARIPRRELASPAPLSYSQELLWLLSQLEAQGVAYNAPAAFRLQGPIDRDALQQALDGLVSRHEILRTTYDLVDDHPVQIIAPSASIELRFVDLSTLPEAAREEELQRFLHAESEHAFDLRVDPVLRPFLIRLGPDDHVFFNVMHHIATDGWSRSVLHGELKELYEAAMERREPRLAPLAVQYADYATWHRQWLDGGVLDEQLDYWREALRSVPSRLELPTDRPRPAARAYVGDHTSRMLSMEVRERLESIAREGDATLFMVLLAGYAALLHRYSGQDDIVIGTPFAGRHRSELESMIGYFINPLALRVDVSGDPSFRELLRRAREATLSAFAHADVPYEMVVRATAPERDLSQTPVFQVMMVLHNPEWEHKRPKFEPVGVTATELVHEKGWAKFDLLLGMSQRPGGLNTTWEYSTELFDDATAVRLGAHFDKLLSSIAADPNLPVSRLQMLLEEERSTILSDWSQARTAFPTDRMVKDLFEESAAAVPDADAVVFEGDRLTYRELDERANRLAHRLRRLGVGPGRRVGIYMGKSLDLVVAVLGVIKAGGGFVPLDPMYPADRIEFMLEDAQPAVVVARPDEMPPLLDGAVPVFSAWGELEHESVEPLPTEACGQDLAYVIYTSGSTGRPKGAMITNASLVNAFYAYDDAYRVTDDTSCHLQMASFSFDVFTGDLIRSLLSRSKLVLCPLETVMDPERLYSLMRMERVDCAEFVPAVATMLCEHVEAVGGSLDFMRVIVVSSEGWRTDKHELYARVCGPQTRLINAYGLTEATIDSTYFEAESELVPDRFVPIGKPLANSEIYLLDRNLEPVPVGVPGELCIGGTGVALGYLNRPELTADRFVDNPFSPGTAMYRTGDLARWLPSGDVEFLGRADRQLKIRGFRIEPGEIEAALERQPEIRTAAVLTWERRPGDTQLAAYFEPADAEHPPGAHELRDRLAAELPAFMVPSTFICVGSFALTPNGKLDRDALPTPETAQFEEEVVEPRNDTERELVRIWRNVLEIEDQPIGVTDDFFALGGHSLLAVRVFAEIERGFGIKLPLGLLFQGATIENLAAALGQKERRDEAWATIVPIRTGGTRPPLFVIAGSDGEFLHYREFLDALDSNQPIYGLQPNLRNRSDPPTTIAGIADMYVRDILEFLPEDAEIMLAGYCFSGLVAFEAARQLEQLGRHPTLLAIIDSYYARSKSRQEIEKEKFADFFERDLRGKAAWIKRRAKGLWFKIRTRTRWVVADALKTSGVTVEGIMTVKNATLRARLSYDPDPAPVRGHLFRCLEEGRDWTRPLEFWHELAASGLEVHELGRPGIRHDNVLKEAYALDTAHALEAVIDAVLSDTGTEPDQMLVPAAG
ncbi:MAG TPA: amino acid adenylation domain-containing protein [Gaiellaceae bacterium]|nr:amino acid adenylation domain-containing protein [Gaiellaceae bacterium]